MLSAKAQSQEEEAAVRREHDSDDECEAADAESVEPPSEFDKEDMDLYFRMRDELASVAVSEPGPAYMTYNLGYMGGRGCRFDMPVRRKVSMGILIRGNDIITYIAGEIV